MRTFRTHRFAALLILGLAALPACQKDAAPKGPRLQDALPDLPLPADPVFISRSAGEDALQVVLSTAMSPDSAAAFYRVILSRKPWKLVSDQAMDRGGRAFSATRDGPPIWVTVMPDTDGVGSRISLNGAVVPRGRDTVKPAPAADSGKKPKP